MTLALTILAVLCLAAVVLVLLIAREIILTERVKLDITLERMILEMELDDQARRLHRQKERREAEMN